MLKPRYQHSNGQLPAYEWNFGDVNPPVHAWATLFQYRIEQAMRGEGDVDFLKRAFGKLLINFTWWVNRKDRLGKSVFEGGFLGLDNIGVFDRSAELPTGGHLEQADGTAWMAMFCQNMFEIAIELAAHDPSYDDLVFKFAEHFLWIGAALNKVGDDGMWDEEDGFYYDVLRLPDGRAARLKVRSLVGLLPLCATTVIEPWQRERVPRVVKSLAGALRPHSGAARRYPPDGSGAHERRRPDDCGARRCRPVAADPLAPAGRAGVPEPATASARCRSGTSSIPTSCDVGGKEYEVAYQPAESDSAMFGGNSNWRGPVWFPMNVLLIRALFQFHAYYGDSFRVECPTGSGRLMTLFEVGAGASPIACSASSCATRTAAAPVFGGTEKFQKDPHWRDCIPFYEYFHGDNGAGLGASHQTGWTALVAALAQIFGTVDARAVLESGREGIRAGTSRQRSDGGSLSRDRSVMTLEVLADVDSVARHAAEVIAGEARAAVTCAWRIATDHGGTFSLKEELITRLRAAGHEIVDFGAHALECGRRLSRLRRAARRGRGRRDRCERGVAICGSGVGASVCANKVAGIRAGARPRSLLREAGRRGRSPQHPLHGRTDGRARPSPGISSRRSSAPSSVRPIGICGGWRKWRAWKRRRCGRRGRRVNDARRDLDARHRDRSTPRQRGTSFPLGATIGPGGVNFSVFSKHATGVQLLFFDRVDAATPTRVVDLDPRTPALVPLLARIRARHHGRSALRLPRRRAVRSGARTSFRPRQGAARSLRQVRGAAGGLESRGGARAGRQLRLGLEERRRRPGRVRLGGRPSAAHALCQDGHLRDARRRLHAAPQLRRRGAEARHVSQA